MGSGSASHIGWKVANAPCSWGVIENIDGDRSDYRRVLDEMQQSGYAGTELGDWGFMPTDPVQLRDDLASQNLELIGSWVTVFLHDPARQRESREAALRAAKLLAAAGAKESVVVLGNDPYADPIRTRHAGRIAPSMELSAAEWRTFTRGAVEIAESVRSETGLRTTLHHHIGTWIETPQETRRFLEMTDARLIGLCFDTGHWTFAGGDAVCGIREHVDRIWHVHFKDHDPRVANQSRVEEWDGPKSIGNGVFCELGAGNVDFVAVTSVLGENGYRGWIVVEQDVLPGMGKPVESARRNRDYLTRIGL